MSRFGLAVRLRRERLTSLVLGGEPVNDPSWLAGYPLFPA
jgi:hypothetical protein